MNINFNLVVLVVVPCIVVALGAYFSMQLMLKKELLKQRFEVLKGNQKEALPLKLQAYERFTLLLDRISLQKLLVRITPVDSDKEAYKHLLLATIDQEFEHNTTQQIYISDDCWKAIVSAKSTIISQLHQLGGEEAVINASSFREIGLQKFGSVSSSNQIAQSFIRTEVGELF